MSDTGREYHRSRTVARRGWWALAGAFFCGVATAFTFRDVLSRPPDGSFPFLPIMYPVLAAISAMQAYALLRTPARIRVDTIGLHLYGAVGSQSVSWSTVAAIERDKFQENARAAPVDVLVLRDERGRRLARVLGGLDGFPELVREVEQRSSAARGGPTYDGTREVQRKLAAQRRERRLLLGMCLVFLPGGLFLIVEGGRDLFYRRAFDREGVPGEARIVRRYTFNVTPRLEYAFEDGRGEAHTADVAMESPAWDALAGADRVRIVFLPSSPGHVRLAQGELDLNGSPAVSLAIGVLALVMSAAGLIFIKKGYATFAPKDGRLRAVRYGDVDS